MKIKRLILCAVSVIMLAGCSVGNSDMVDPSTVDANVLYLYDVKNNAIKAGEELSEDGSDGFWMPISDDVYAEFQNPDCIGAWSPNQYFGAKELKEGFENGTVGFCSRFRWSTGEDGKIACLYEENYYEDNNVTGDEENNNENSNVTGNEESGENSDMVDPSAVDASILYLFDVKNNKIKVGEEWSEDGSGGFWLPLSGDVYAEFQDPDWIGAWSPEQYFGADELEEGFEEGVVGFGSRFTWSTGDDGKIAYLYEENYYENCNVTGDEEVAYTYYLYDVKDNEVKVSEEWSADGSDGYWLPLSDDVYAEFQDPRCDGAWSPMQYFGADELQEGFESGVIGFGSQFTGLIGADGEITQLYEKNYYEDDVTGFMEGE